MGAIERVEIANMHQQTAARAERLLQAVPDARTALIAVAAGSGNRKLFESFGVDVIEGGQSMNPAVGDLAAAVEQQQAADVILLPNNSNVIGAAEQAVAVSGANVHVVPTRSIQEGLTATVAFDPSASAQENVSAMQSALRDVVTGEVTIAVRAASLNGVSIRRGDYLGLALGEPVACGASFDEVALAVVERLLSEPRDVLTLLTGEAKPDLAALVRKLEEDHPGLELEVQEGGQPHYPLLLAAE